MSLLSSIGSFFAPVVNTVKTAGQALLGGAASTLFSSVSSKLGAPAQALGASLPATAGTAAGGVMQSLSSGGTAPYRLPSNLPATIGTPTGAPAPGGLMRSIGQGLGTLASGALAGATGRGFSKTKIGKLTGNMIPAGYVERMSPSGVVYLARQKRRRGITARDLSAYRRVDRLVHRIARAHPRRGK